MRWALVLALAACTRVEDRFWPEPPPMAGARSIILVLADDQIRNRYAADLDDQGALAGDPLEVVTIDRGVDPELTALYYNRSLAELGLSSGVLGAVDDCLLAHPIFAAASTGADWMSLDPAASAASVVDPETCRLSSACRNFRVSSVLLPGEAEVRFARTFGGDSALVGRADGSFYEIDFESAEPATAYAGLPSLSSTIDRDGDLWLGGKGGRIVRGPVGGPFTEILSGEPDEEITALAESIQGERRMLAVGVTVLTSTSAIVRILEVTPESRVLGTYRMDVNKELCEIEWYGARAIAVCADKTALVIDGDRVIEVKPAGIHPLGEPVYSSIGMLDGDIYLGGSIGLLFRSSDLENWTMVETPRLGTKMQALRPFERGLLSASEEGVIGQYYPLRAACPTQGLLSIEVAELVFVGARVLATGNARGLDDNLAFWLEPL
jgi:hypothetical protein